MPTHLTQLADGREGTNPAPADFRARQAAARAAREQEERTRREALALSKAAKARDHVAKLAARHLAASDDTGHSDARPAPSPSVPSAAAPPVALAGAAEAVSRAAAAALAAEPEPWELPASYEHVGELAPVEADQAAAEERAQAQRALNHVRDQLGRWSKDSEARLRAHEVPETAAQRHVVDRLGRETFAVCRLATVGSHIDLAYALDCMLRLMGGRVEVLGSFVAQAMGLGYDGHAERQLWSVKARRQLVRSFALFRASRVQRLKDIEPRSTSEAPVRGVRKLPQAALAQLCAQGDHVWSRSTTARDATAASVWGLWKRIRLTVDLAPEDERRGPSKQVVSRYAMWVPPRGGRGMRRAISKLSDIADKLAADGGMLRETAYAWVRSVGEEAVRFAVGVVPQLSQLRFAAFPHVPGLMEPQQHAPAVSGTHSAT